MASDNFKTYAKLNKFENFDGKAVEQYAEASNELAALEARRTELIDLISDNIDLSKQVWRTLDGHVIAIHQLTDQHLTNIMRHCLQNGRTIPARIVHEARKRDIVVPQYASLWESDPKLPETSFRNALGQFIKKDK